MLQATRQLINKIDQYKATPTIIDKRNSKVKQNTKLKQ
jgi:hypothetical protein